MNERGHPPAGIEFTSCTDAGLPVRPDTLPLNPFVEDVGSEDPGGNGISSSVSASADLATALGGRPLEEQCDTDEVEPFEARAPRRAISPLDPTAAEVEEHKLSCHARFRSWCRHCVRGRGTEGAHSRTSPPPSALPVLSWDYCYLSSARRDAPNAPARGSDESESPVLVMWDSRSKGLYAHIVPAKGVEYEGLEAVLKVVAADLDRLGHKRVVFRNDTEPAIVAFLRELQRYWHGEVVPEAASTGDPQSNGAAEVGVRLLKGGVRTLKDALEFNLSSDPLANRGESNQQPTIAATSGLMSLIVKQVAAAQRLYAVGSDGRTPHERNTGRRHRPAVAEFGEAVYWMPLQTSATKLPPLGARFEDGFYMGTNDGSAETVVLTPTGLVRCRTIRRKPPSERWSLRLLDIIDVTELQPSNVDPNRMKIGIRAPIVVEPVDGEPTAYPPAPDFQPRVPRKQRLLRTDFAEHGFTPGCPGCHVIMYELPGEAHHSTACRTRMEPLLMQSDEGQRRLARAAERVSRYCTAVGEHHAKRLRGGETTGGGTAVEDNIVEDGSESVGKIVGSRLESVTTAVGSGGDSAATLGAATAPASGCVSARRHGWR